MYATGGGSSAIDSASRNRLKMPPVLDAKQSGRIELIAQLGKTEFLEGRVSASLGFNQNYLGPTIVIGHDQEVATSIKNRWSRPISVHWHGLLVPGAVDGGPHLPIATNGTWKPILPIEQPPCTAWYHTHVHERTASQVYHGLAGIIQVQDGRDDDRGLPSTYGVDDLTLVLQDRRFSPDGKLDYGLSMMDVMHGFVGDRIVVNGQIDPVAVVPRGIVRLRLINGSNARIYTLSANDNRPLHLIATDGGYLPGLEPMDSLMLSPGERAEVLIDFSAGKGMTLVSDGDPNQGPAGMMGRFRRTMDFFVDRSFDVLPFRVDAQMPARINELPANLGGTLAKHSRSPDVSREILLDMGMMGGMMMGGSGMMGGFAINGRPFDMDRLNFEIAQGSLESWRVRSPMLAHPFHIHGVHFQILSENEREPSVQNRGWKDTVLVDGEVELLVRFDQTASREKPFMFHCHILEHEDRGMMGQFAVV